MGRGLIWPRLTLTLPHMRPITIAKRWPRRRFRRSRCQILSCRQNLKTQHSLPLAVSNSVTKDTAGHFLTEECCKKLQSIRDPHSLVHSSILKTLTKPKCQEDGNRDIANPPRIGGN